MKDRLFCLYGLIDDLKTGKAIDHQPKRKTSHSKWYIKEALKEGRDILSPNYVRN